MAGGGAATPNKPVLTAALRAVEALCSDSVPNKVCTRVHGAGCELAMHPPCILQVSARMANVLRAVCTVMTKNPDDPEIVAPIKAVVMALVHAGGAYS